MTGNRFVRFAAALSVLFSVLCLSASAQNGARVVEPWVHPGWIGGILGSTLGILGGVVGTLGGVFASRGKAVKLTLGVHAFAFLLSVVSLVVGIAAFLSGQPYGVWFGFGYGGLLGAIIFGVLFPVLLKRIREAEHRKSMLEDLTRSLENTENPFLLKIRAMLTEGALTPSAAKALVEAYEESRGMPQDNVPT